MGVRGGHRALFVGHIVELHTESVRRGGGALKHSGVLAQNRLLLGLA